jgi:peroxiredoxin Q/BCP
LANPKLAIGKRAPAFTLKDDRGDKFRLTDHRGRWMIIFFCPAHIRSSCSDQASQFNKYLDGFKDAGAFLIGISNAAVPELADIRTSSGLPFPLLSDSSLKVASKYGSYRTVNRGGSEYETNIRCSFIVDPSGKIVSMYDNYRVSGHVERVYKAFLKISQD